MTHKTSPELIEKRLRRHIRVHKLLLDSKQKYNIFSDDSLEFHTAKKMLERIFKGRLKLTEVKKKSKGCIIPISLEEYISWKLSYYFDNKPFDEEHHIFLLQNILEEELLMLKKKYKLKGSLQKTKFKRERVFIEAIAKDYPEVKFGMLKSIEHVLKYP